MNKKLLTIITILIAALAASAQLPDPALQDIVDSYVPWGSAEFNGKLKIDKLPVNPTVKIFMIRDSLLQISLRAPMVGEVGRVNITKEEVLIVNKLKRVYCRENPAKLLELYPGFISDIQSLLLARVVILGQGEMSAGNMESVAIEEEETGNWYLLPQTDPGLIPFRYGYVVGKNARTREFMAKIDSKGSLTIDYDYRDRGMQMDIMFDRKGRKVKAELDFNSVKWGGAAMATPRLLDYTRVSLGEFFSSLK